MRAGAATLLVRAQVDLGEPSACFTTEPANGEIIVGEVIVFDARCSTGVSSDASYQWDLGDGRTRTGAYINVRYREAGNYTVELRVQDRGMVSTARNDVRVSIRVSACFTFERLPFAGDRLPCSFSFDASCSEGSIREYRWFFEGSPHFPDDDTTVTTTSAQIEHTWAHNMECVAFRPFERLVRLTVVSSNGNTETVEQTVPVTRP